MTVIYDADQADRKPPVNWPVVATRDEARRKSLRQIMEAGGLGTGKDFEHASFILQHGREPNDQLLAHVLAVTAVSYGDKGAVWIAAASLDRYLQRIGQKQVFGTQYITPNTEPRITTQEPYDRSLVSDAVRRANLVEPLAEQEKITEGMSKHLPPH